MFISKLKARKEEAERIGVWGKAKYGRRKDFIVFLELYLIR